MYIRETILTRYLKFILDTLGYFLSVFISILFYSAPFSSTIYEINYYLIFGGYLLFIISIINYKGYKQSAEFSIIRETTSVINAAVLTITVSIIFLFIFQIHIPNFITTTSEIAFSITLIFAPAFLRIIINNLTKNRIEIEPILLIGFGEMGKSFIDIASDSKWSRFNILGVLDDNYKKGSDYKGYKVLDNIKSLENYIGKDSTVNRIIVAVRHLSEEKINFLDYLCSNYGKSLNFLPSIESFQNNPGKLKEHAGIPLISKRIQSQSLFLLIGKRTLDIIISLLGLIISIPFWIIIPLLIKKNSKGSILFKHSRVGIDGNHFLLYKFRSMYKEAPKYAHCPTIGDDPRVTKIGKWLRKTSLDELPQLFNVLKGEMSMVGPRPEMPFIVDKYNYIEKKRLLIKPGLTGLWQISPHRTSEISHNLEYDFYYIENQGIILDFVILILTFFLAIRGLTH